MQFGGGFGAMNNFMNNMGNMGMNNMGNMGGYGGMQGGFNNQQQFNNRFNQNQQGP
jgi:hypothetical protein